MAPNKRATRQSNTPEQKQYVMNKCKEMIKALQKTYVVKVSSATVDKLHGVMAVAHAEAAISDAETAIVAAIAVSDADAAVADAALADAKTAVDDAAVAVADAAAAADADAAVAAAAATVSGAGTNSEGLTAFQADLCNALSAVIDKMVWATQQLQSSSSVEDSLQLIGLISESCKAITALQNVNTKEEIRN